MLRDRPTHFLDALGERGITKMSVTLRRAGLAVTQDLAHHGERHAGVDRVARRGVSEIVKPNVVQPDTRADRHPRFRQRDPENRCALRRRDNVLARVVPGAGLAKKLQSSRGERNGSPAVLAVGEIDDAVVPIDHRPREGQNLVATHACVSEETKRADRLPPEPPASPILEVGNRLEVRLETLALVRRQVSLAGLLREPLHPCSGRRKALGQDTPLDRSRVEALQDDQPVVGFAWRRGLRPMPLDDLRALDLVQTPAAEARKDHCTKKLAVLVVRAMLETDVHVLDHEALREVPHEWGGNLAFNDAGRAACSD